MKTLKTFLIGAVALGASALAMPAQAHDWHHHHHYYSHGRVIYYSSPYYRHYYYDDGPYYRPYYGYYRPYGYGYYSGPGFSIGFGGSFHHRHWR